MTRPKVLVLVSIIALVIAGMASFLAYDFLKKQMASANRGVAVLTAAADIPVGTRLEPPLTKAVMWPKEGLLPGYFTDPAKLSGRVAIRPLAAGDVITEAKLVPQTGGGRGIMTYLVPQGHRAVTAAVNEVAGVAGFITPGSRVDVVLTTQRPGKKEENVSKIILENVPVLATGQITDQKDGKPVVVPTVTLDLVPADAEKLVLSASSKGGLQPLQLLLRNIVDSDHVESKGATIAKVLTGVDDVVKMRPVARKPVVREKPMVLVKAVPPPLTYTLEIVRGAEKSIRQYTE
jgi:pilus assembly protein CpaB